MKTAHRYALLAAIAVSAAPVLAQDAAAGASQIYQQRTADGRVVLTDRPLDGARTERTWAFSREDPDAARDRSERVRLEAQAVAERIQRRLEFEEQRADRYEIDRLRFSLAEAQRDAEIARDSAFYTGAVVWPGAVRRPLHHRPLHDRPLQHRPLRPSMHPAL